MIWRRVVSRPRHASLPTLDNCTWSPKSVVEPLSGPSWLRELCRELVVGAGMLVDPIALAHDCVTSEAFEVELLHALERSIGFDTACFMVDGDMESIRALGLDAKALAQIPRRAETYARDLLPVKQSALTGRGVAVDTEVCGETRVRKTSYYRELVSKLNGRHSLMAYVRWRDRIVATIMLGRNTATFSAREKALVESLLPAVAVGRAAYGLPTRLDVLRSSQKNVFQRVFDATGSRVLASVATAGSEIIVRDRGGFREMVARNGASELVWTRVSLNDSRRSGWPYIELLHVAAALARQRRRALFIGVGGAVGVRQFAAAYPGLAIDVVECEVAVIELARTWFELDNIPGVTVHLADGVEFIGAATPATWDVVVIDAYDASTFDEKFSDGVFLAKVRAVLRPGGAMACNVIGSLSGSSAVQRFLSAARGHFEQMRLLPVVALGERYAPDTLRNVVVVGVRQG